VDLFLIHSPHGGDNVETWRALVELQDEGLAKNIGVSNFNIHHMEGLSQAGLKTPDVNQFELHPWNQYKDVVKYCREKGIVVMGYCPLARCKYFGTPRCALVEQLSEKYKKTNAQILLRWSLQSGFVTIPKSSNSDRIAENADIFHWCICESDMKLMDELDEEGGCVGLWNAHMLAGWEG